MHQGTPHFNTNPRGSGLSASTSNSSVAAGIRTDERTQKSTTKLFNVSQRTCSLLGVQIVATGSYVPDLIVTNEELEQRYDFDPGWVEQRTGILELRHLPQGQGTSDMAVEAAREAIRAAHIDKSEIDLLIVATLSPDYIGLPSTACIVQDRLGLDVPAFDVSAACSGFMYALTTGAQYIATGNSKRALVIGADTNSRYVNPTDQRTAPLFGDGAGAVILAPGDPHQGLTCYQLGADGSGGDFLKIPVAGSRNPSTVEQIQNEEHFLQMDGRSVFKWAVRALTDTIELVLNKTGMTVHDVDHFLLHQANIRIINYAIEQLGIPPEKVHINLHKYGNTSAGTIPLAIDEVFREGRINRGDNLLLSGFGAGLTWGTGLFRW